MDPSLPTLTGDVQTFAGVPLVSFDAVAGTGFQKPNNVFVPQFIEYPLDITFTQASLSAFPTPSGPSGPGPVLGDSGSITEKLTATLQEPLVTIQAHRQGLARLPRKRA
jgi:hypothetical protein